MILPLFILFSFIIAEPNFEKPVELKGPDHISLIVHQDLINDFFKNLGKIQGTKNPFQWNLKNPRINIRNNKAVFNAEIQIYNNIIVYHNFLCCIKRIKYFISFFISRFILLCSCFNSFYKFL